MSFLDPVVNFGQAVVSGIYNASVTLVTLNSGEVSKLPASPGFNLVWYNATDYPNPGNDPNAEIVRVTGISGNDLTITRGQESTVARTHNIVGKVYIMVLVPTKKFRDDIESKLVGLIGTLFSVKVTSNQGSIHQNVGTVVNFDSKNFDLGNEFSTTNKEFVCTKAGYYHFNAQVYLASAPIGSTCDLTIVKIDGGTSTDIARDSEYIATGQNAITLKASGIVYLDPGNKVKVYFAHSAVGDQTISNTAALTKFEGKSVYSGA